MCQAEQKHSQGLYYHSSFRNAVFQLSIQQLIQTSVTSPCEPLGYMIALLIPISSHYKLFWFFKHSVSFAAFFTPTACPGFTDLHSCMSVGLLSHLLPFYRLSSLKMCICTCTIRSSEKLVCYGPSSFSQNMVCPNIALYINIHVFLDSEPLLWGCLSRFPPLFVFGCCWLSRWPTSAPFRSQKSPLLIINTYLFTVNYKIYTLFCF